MTNDEILQTLTWPTRATMGANARDRRQPLITPLAQIVIVTRWFPSPGASQAAARTRGSCTIGWSLWRLWS